MLYCAATQYRAILCGASSSSSPVVNDDFEVIKEDIDHFRDGHQLQSIEDMSVDHLIEGEEIGVARTRIVPSSSYAGRFLHGPPHQGAGRYE